MPHEPAHAASRRPRTLAADRFGASAALLCAIHCALWPLAIAAVPALGLSLVADPGFERAFVVFAIVLALATLAYGYRRHRAVNALMFLVPGVLALLFGAFGPLPHDTTGHAVVMAIGGTLIAAAHVLNIRLAHGHVHDAACAHRH